MASLGQRRIRPDRGRLVEVEQHRRMLLDRNQHVLEAAHQVRPDRFIFEQPGKTDGRRLGCRHCEMVRPEVGQPLGEGGRGGQRAVDARTDEGRVDLPPGHTRGHQFGGPGRLGWHRCGGDQGAGGRIGLSRALGHRALLEIVGKLDSNTAAVGNSRDVRLKAGELLARPAARIAANRRTVAARTEPEAVFGKARRYHRSLPWWKTQMLCRDHEPIVTRSDRAAGPDRPVPRGGRWQSDRSCRR